MSEIAPLTQSCYRLLTDKMYDKRKLGAAELEKLARDILLCGEGVQAIDQLDGLLDRLCALCHSTHAHIVKGGLIGVATLAICVTPACAQLSEQQRQRISSRMLTTLLGCLHGTADSRMRYYAAEALYNTVKSVRTHVVGDMFCSVWVTALTLKCDPDVSVRGAADVLNRLLQDLVLEDCTRLRLQEFLAQVREHIYTQDRCTRHLIITWLVFIYSIPRLSLVSHVAHLLDGLFLFLADTDSSLVASTCCLLDKLLAELCCSQAEIADTAAQPSTTVAPSSATSQVSCAPVDTAQLSVTLSVLLVQARSTHCSCIVHAALTWLLAFARCHVSLLLSQLGAVLHVTLHCLRVTPPQQQQSTVTPGEIRRLARALSDCMRAALTQQTLPTVDVAAVVDVLLNHLDCGGEGGVHTDTHRNTRTDSRTDTHTDTTNSDMHITCMQWLTHLHSVDCCALTSQCSSTDQQQASTRLEQVVSALSRVLICHSSSDQLALTTVQLLASISASCGREVGGGSRYLDSVISSYIDCVKCSDAANCSMLSDGCTATVYRYFCSLLDAEQVLTCTAEHLLQNSVQQPQFMRHFVRTLNVVVVCAPELHTLRLRLQYRPNNGNHHGNDGNQHSENTLFGCIFPVWCHCPVSALCLCLLSRRYELANHLAATFDSIHVDADTLTQLDKLVQLTETPVFAPMRLHMAANRHLVACMLSVLMLLPQSSAFHTLHVRLSALVHASASLCEQAGPRTVRTAEIERLVAVFETTNALYCDIDDTHSTRVN